MPAERGGLYSMLPLWWVEYECPYLLIVPTPSLFPYYCGLFLCGGFEGIRRIFILTMSELVVLNGDHFFLYAAEEVPDYFVGLIRLDHVEDCILYLLPRTLVNMLSHLRF